MSNCVQRTLALSVTQLNKEVVESFFFFFSEVANLTGKFEKYKEAVS